MPGPSATASPTSPTSLSGRASRWLGLGEYVGDGACECFYLRRVVGGLPDKRGFGRWQLGERVSHRAHRTMNGRGSSSRRVQRLVGPSDPDRCFWTLFGQGSNPYAGLNRSATDSRTAATSTDPSWPSANDGDPAEASHFSRSRSSSLALRCSYSGRADDPATPAAAGAGLTTVGWTSRSAFLGCEEYGHCRRGAR
jgi:hypothetical protein